MAERGRAVEVPVVVKGVRRVGRGAGTGGVWARACWVDAARVAAGEGAGADVEEACSSRVLRWELSKPTVQLSSVIRARSIWLSTPEIEGPEPEGAGPAAGRVSLGVNCLVEDFWQGILPDRAALTG